MHTGNFTGGEFGQDPPDISRIICDVTIPVASVSTTNAKVDGELRGGDWFDAEHFPTIHFISRKVTRTGPGRASIAGILTFHGVDRPVVLQAQFNAGGINPMTKAYTVGFDAATSLKRTDYGVKNYVPLIGDNIDVRISAAFERKA